MTLPKMFFPGTQATMGEEQPVQIMPATGWTAVYATSEKGVVERTPLVCWMLTSSNRLVGIDWCVGALEVRVANDDANFVDLIYDPSLVGQEPPRPNTKDEKVGGLESAKASAQVMTPQHPDWRHFAWWLEKELSWSGCDHTMGSIARALRDIWRFTSDEVAKSVQYLADHYSTCGCGILSVIQEKRLFREMFTGRRHEEQAYRRGVTGIDPRSLIELQDDQSEPDTQPPETGTTGEFKP